MSNLICAAQNMFVVPQHYTFRWAMGPMKEGKEKKKGWMSDSEFRLLLTRQLSSWLVPLECSHTQHIYEL